MTIVVFLCNTPGSAVEIAEAVEAGELFGVDMGTTSEAAVYHRYAIIRATETRANAIQEANPDPEIKEIIRVESDPDSFTDSTGFEKYWFLRGKLGG